MKTNKWIFAIVIAASFAWTACDDDDDSVNKPDLNDTDEMFVETTARSNMGEIELGKLAVTKATDSLVKVFAQEMVTEHTAAQNELKDLADDYNGVDWPNSLTVSQDSTKESLNEATGHTFDTLYIRSQVKMHEDAVAAFQTASSNSTDARVKAYATKYLPHIQMHLERADSLETSIMMSNGTDSTTDGGTTDGATTDGTGSN
jgi:putative membrane protein